MIVELTIGVDLSAYTTVEVDVDSTEADALAAAVENLGDDSLHYEEDWGTANGMRIVFARDDYGEEICANIPLEASAYNGGAALADWLNGKGGIAELVSAAEDAMLIGPVENTTYAGALTGPNGENVRIGFVARRGATQEELMVAFLRNVASEGWSLDLVAAPAVEGSSEEHGISASQIQAVLEAYSLRVADTKGRSFAEMAEDLIDEIDLARIERAAMDAGQDPQNRARAVSEAIKTSLVEIGVLEF